MDDEQPPCCDAMASAETPCDGVHREGEICPDQLVVMIGHRRALPIRDGGSSGVVIRRCPWCGTRV